MRSKAKGRLNNLRHRRHHSRSVAEAGDVRRELFANCRRHDRRVEFVVMDDTASLGPAAPDVAQATRARLRALTDGQRTIRYAGAREKKRFTDARARESSVPRSVIEFGAHSASHDW